MTFRGQLRLMRQLTSIALRSLAQRKTRTALTMLGVIIGVGAVIVMVAIGEGAKASVARTIKGLGTNLLVVSPGFSRRGPVRASNVETLTAADAEAILARVQGVVQVAPELGQNVQVKYLAQNTNTTVLGVTPGWATVNNYTLRRGRFLDDLDQRNSQKVAVLGATVVTNLFPDTRAVGQTIKVRGHNFKVVGTLESKGQGGGRDPDNQILIPLTTAQDRLFGTDALRTLSVQIVTEDQMDRAQADIEALLRERHRLADEAASDFTIGSQKELLESASAVSDTFTALLAAVAAVSLLVGGIGIMNIMLVSVTERTREIGIRKAIGARSRDILFQFLVESVVLSGIGGLLGVAAGVGGSRLVSSVAGWETAIESSSILLAFGVAMGIGVFFGMYPAQKASGLDPIEALRHE
ncbi:MAG: ABC transporter permease [Myxococcota bacterium]|nr:ABC transporter permease [Myxococcota bacterium]